MLSRLPASVRRWMISEKSLAEILSEQEMRDPSV